jgi:hypothetical protein
MKRVYEVGLFGMCVRGFLRCNTASDSFRCRGASFYDEIDDSPTFTPHAEVKRSNAGHKDRRAGAAVTASRKRSKARFSGENFTLRLPDDVMLVVMRSE